MQLRKIESAEDISRIYEYMKINDAEIVSRCKCADAFVEYFTDRLRSYYHDFFIICRDGIEVGFVCSYDYRVYDSHCSIDFMIDGEHSEKVAVIGEFVNLLFKEYPIRKVFAQMWRKDQLEVLSDSGFVQEVCLSEYLFCDGKYVDCYILSKMGKLI